MGGILRDGKKVYHWPQGELEQWIRYRSAAPEASVNRTCPPTSPHCDGAPHPRVCCRTSPTAPLTPRTQVHRTPSTKPRLQAGLLWAGTGRGICCCRLHSGDRFLRDHLRIAATPASVPSFLVAIPSRHRSVVVVEIDCVTAHAVLAAKRYLPATCSVSIDIDMPREQRAARQQQRQQRTGRDTASDGVCRGQRPEPIVRPGCAPLAQQTVACCAGSGQPSKCMAGVDDAAEPRGASPIPAARLQCVEGDALRLRGGGEASPCDSPSTSHEVSNPADTRPTPAAPSQQQQQQQPETTRHQRSPNPRRRHATPTADARHAIQKRQEEGQAAAVGETRRWTQRRLTGRPGPS